MEKKLYEEFYSLHTIREVEPYLNEYFGISYTHFSVEVSDAIATIRDFQLKIRKLQQQIETKQEEKSKLQEKNKDGNIDNTEKAFNSRKVAILNSEIGQAKRELDAINLSVPEWKSSCQPLLGNITMSYFVEQGVEIILHRDFEDNDFFKLFQSKRKSTETDIDMKGHEVIFNVLWFLTIVVRRRRLYESAGNYSFSKESPYKDQRENDETSNDIMQLFNYVNNNDLSKGGAHVIAIKHSTGTINLKNYNNWFWKVIEGFLATVDLEKIKETRETSQQPVHKGRNPKDYRKDVIIYGIYMMFRKELKIKPKMPNDLSDFIVRYLDFVGLRLEAGKRTAQHILLQVESIRESKNEKRRKFGFKI